MPNFLLPLLPEYKIEIPEEPIAWIGWAVWFILLLLVSFLLQDRKSRLDVKKLAWLALFSVLILFLTPFFGFQLESINTRGDGALPVQHLMLFAAVPWIFAGAMLGVIPGALIAGMSGLLLAYLDTHNIFTPLLFMTFTVLFSWFVRQRYRTILFRLLSFPLLGAGVSLFLTIPLIFFALLLSTSGPISYRMGVAFEDFLGVVLTFGGMILIGGIICLIFWVLIRNSRDGSKPLIPSPGERSLSYRLLVVTGSILILLLMTLWGGAWSMNISRAQNQKVNHLIDTANIAAESLPVFVEAGGSYLLQEAQKDETLNAIKADANFVLLEYELPIQLFDHLFVVDQDGNVIASSSLDPVKSPMNNVLGLAKLSNSPGDLGKVVVISSIDPENNSIVVNFLTPIEDLPEGMAYYLVGQTLLSGNPLTDNMLNAFDAIEESGGQIQVITRDGDILYHSDHSQIMKTFEGMVNTTPTYQEATSIEGKTSLAYFRPIHQLGWAISIMLPMEAVYDLAWEDTFPVILFGSISLMLFMLVGFLGFHPVIRAINQNKLIPQQILNTDILGLREKKILESPPKGRKGFNRIKGSRRKILSTQSDFIKVKNHLIDPRNIKSALKILLGSVINDEISSIRVVLAENQHPRKFTDGTHTFGLGSQTDLLAGLDEIILKRVQNEGMIKLMGSELEEAVKTLGDSSQTALIIAEPLKWEGQCLGALWIAYQGPYEPDDEAVASVHDLAREVAFAVRTAQSWEQFKTLNDRLISMLGVLPESVFILDSKDIIRFVNSTARRFIPSEENTIIGQHVSKALPRDMVVFLDSVQNYPQKQVLQNADNVVYEFLVDLLTVSEGETGRGVVIRDVTEIKAEEKLNKEFVTTVSHELRSPLTLIHGYAKILRLTGNLNEQQDMTMQKIIDGIEEMKHLVQNLLDINILEDGSNLEFKMVDAGELIADVVRSLEAKSKQKNVQLVVSSPEKPLLIEANPIFIKQALKNLLDNAIKFTDLGGEVGMSIHCDDNSVLFSVKDNGMGIAPLDQRKLFEKFPKINSTISDDSNGGGLGLAIVKSIADRHGGKVWVESQLGRGSTFYLQIPRKKG